MKTYVLKPTMTFETVTDASDSLKRGDKETSCVTNAIAPAAKPRTPISTLPPVQSLPRPVIDPNKPMLKLGLDVHLVFIMAAIQRGHTTPHTPRKLSEFELVSKVKAWVAEGFQVFCVQESCGFGFGLHRSLVEAGAQSFVITPIALNGKRKTDKLDARALCQRLTRFLDGDRSELSPIRIPTADEQRKREAHRRRKFLQKLLRSLANRGHGQMAEYFHLPLPHRWWGARNWKKVTSLMEPWMRQLLESLREVILTLDKQLQELEKILVQRVKDQPIPKGLGEVSLVTLDAEICDWNRFYNRKQIGSYTGCCPSEHSSGGHQRIGCIDRLGNGRVRTVLVEAVWRLLQWQPGWKAAQKMKLRLAGGAAMRKKTVVALARQLAVDLWRWRTGRATMEDLGWIPA
jgi:transposase